MIGKKQLGDRHWLTLEESAAYIGTTYEAIRKLVKRERIQAFYKDRRWKISVYECDRYVTVRQEDHTPRLQLLDSLTRSG